MSSDEMIMTQPSHLRAEAAAVSDVGIKPS